MGVDLISAFAGDSSAFPGWSRGATGRIFESVGGSGRHRLIRRSCRRTACCGESSGVA